MGPGERRGRTGPSFVVDADADTQPRIGVGGMEEASRGSRRSNSRDRVVATRAGRTPDLPLRQVTET